MKRFLLVAVNMNDTVLPVLVINAESAEAAINKISEIKGKDFLRNEFDKLHSWQMNVLDISDLEEI